MGETTNISWADATLNFWIGCTKVSPACDHCYAEAYGHRFGVEWGVHQPRRRTSGNLAKAMKLERQAISSGKPLLCFSNSLSDIFDNEVPVEWLADAFAIMRQTPHVTYLLLTKRPGNIVKRSRAAGGLPPNAAIGCTAVNQMEWDRDAPTLALSKAALKASVAFVSIEPMLGPIDTGIELSGGFFDWIIAGGESGPAARPAHPDWIRDLRDQCAAAGVAFHFKQWGEWAPGIAFGLVQDGPVTDRKGNVRDWMSRYVSTGEWGERVRGHSFTAHSTNLVYRVGKKRAGRALDCVIHDARPPVSPTNTTEVHELNTSSTQGEG